MAAVNGPKTDAGALLIKEFKQHLERVITPRGFWPLPMMVMKEIRGKAYFDIVDCEVNDHQALRAFLAAAGHPDTKACILGIDRYANQKESRLEFDDVLTCFYYERPNFALIEFSNPKDLFSFGVIPYHYKPRVIRDINWGNWYWNQELKLELSSQVPNREIALHQ